MKTFIYILALLAMVSPAMAEEPAYDPTVPPASSWIAAMKIEGATFWLRYAATTAEQVKKTEEALKTPSQYDLSGEGPSAATVWLARVKAAQAARQPPMVLGKIELSAEGNIKAAVKKIEAYARADSAEHMYMLGRLYFHGLGVPKDMKRGYYWIEQSQHQGPHPLISFFVRTDLEAAAAAIAAADEKAGGKKKKVEFNMPGQAAPGADAPTPVGGPSLRMDEAPEPGLQSAAEGAYPVMPGPDEGLVLFPPPYPEE